MSNIIKGYSISYGDNEIKTIDANKRSHHDIIRLRNNLRVIENIKTPNDKNDGQDNTKQFSENVIFQSKREAEQILYEAKKEAEKIKLEALEAVEEAKKKGYSEGLNQGKAQLSSQISQYEAKKNKLDEEYQDMVNNLEPSMVEIICSLLYKITGILVEDKEDIIYHLVDKAMKRMDLSSEYKIKVSKEDYEFMKLKKEDLVSALNRDVHIEIEEDADLIKNQCLIETEGQVIDCSLDTQLKNLVTDMRLLIGE